MPRRGRHRTTGPVRLVAAAAAVLVTGGIVVAAGSASAAPGSDSDGGFGLVGALTGSLGMSDGGDQSSDDQSSSDQSSSDQSSSDQSSSHRSSDDQHSDDQHSSDHPDQGSRDDRSEDHGSQNQGSDQDDQAQSSDQDDRNQGNGQGDQNQDGDQGQGEEQFKGRDKAAPPDASDFVDIRQVERGSGGGQGGRFSAAGTFRSDCGTNADGGHRNSDNLVITPGKRNAAQHVHDYVGTTATTFASSDEELQAASTTCANGDHSTYYWPVIRDLNGTGPDVDDDGGGLDGNFGSILPPKAVDLTFHGNPAENVVAAPEGLRLATGDAKAGTKGDENANAKWTCTGFEDRTTTSYPLCPPGSDLVRILDFPSCWDGQHTDSDDHRSHLVFPADDGSCPRDTKAVPALRMTLTYARPDGRAFAVDSFPDQQHAPKTDHASAINLMPEELMNRAVRCINDGQTC